MRTEPDPPLALTRSLIEASDDEHVELLLLNYVLGVERRAPDRLHTLPVACQAHFIAFFLDGQLLNGGFNQLWFNSPDFAAEAEQALEYLNMTDAAALAREAAEIYKSIQPRHREARLAGTIEAFMATYENGPFEAVDRAYSSRQAEWRGVRISVRISNRSFTMPVNQRLQPTARGGILSAPQRAARTVGHRRRRASAAGLDSRSRCGGASRRLWRCSKHP